MNQLFFQLKRQHRLGRPHMLWYYHDEKDRVVRKYLTVDQYRARVRSMPVKELEVLIETFTIHRDSLNKEEWAIARILDAEMERRILNWEGEVKEFNQPLPFSASRRKFKEINNTWAFAPKAIEVVETPGVQYKVPGSNGAIYVVTDDMGAWSCTCPASKWQKGECKHITKIKLNAQ
jgi:hypothetical protein